MCRELYTVLDKIGEMCISKEIIKVIGILYP